jgi:hypothetical protein
MSQKRTHCLQGPRSRLACFCTRRTAARFRVSSSLWVVCVCTCVWASVCVFKVQVGLLLHQAHGRTLQGLLIPVGGMCVYMCVGKCVRVQGPGWPASAPGARPHASGSPHSCRMCVRACECGRVSVTVCVYVISAKTQLPATGQPLTTNTPHNARNLLHALK